MNRRTVRILLTHELRMLLRDRRTVILAIILPLLLTPLIGYFYQVVGKTQERELQETVFSYAVIGTEADAARALIAFGVRDGQNGENSSPDFKISEASVENPAASLKNREIHFYLRALSGEEADVLEKQQEQKDSEKSAATHDVEREDKKHILPATERLPGVPLIRIYFDASNTVSQRGASNMRNLLWRAVRENRNALLLEHGFQADPSTVIVSHNLAAEGQAAAVAIGRGLTLLLALLMLVGGSVAAIDIVSGEKERGSLETLLTTAVKRSEVVAAKQLTVLSVALTTTFIQVTGLFIFLTYEIIPVPEGFALEVAPAAVAALLLLFIPMAAFLSAALLMVSAYAKSYKEAQLYFFPLFMVSIFPALAALLPGFNLRSVIAVVPLANVSLAVREIMAGKFDWPMIVVVFIVMTAAALLMVRASARMLNQERLIMAGNLDAADLAGGPALFSKRVLRWYVLSAIVFFVAVLNVPLLASFQSQVLFGQLVVFLGGSLLMIRLYGLDIRQAWALRFPRAMVWPAILLLIPSANIMANGVFRLATLILPVPEALLEQFAQSFMLQGIPIWKMLLLVAILPGICEELAFRGTLLYGLRNRFNPVVLAIIVGLIFGLFHFSYFRIIPTAFLGVLLTAITLLTGSIFPAMALHIGNNAFAYFMAAYGFPADDFGWWIYTYAAVVFALCLCVIYRNRTPYPSQ